MEWKCNALNAGSRAAARRFGFRFWGGGIFYRHMITQGINRDTAWYSIIDEEWPAVRTGFEAWLAPENFGDDGNQKKRLYDLIEDARD